MRVADLRAGEFNWHAQEERYLTTDVKQVADVNGSRVERIRCRRALDWLVTKK